MTYFGNIQEEELKLKVGEAFFADFDHTKLLGKIDFTVAEKLPPEQPVLDFYDQEFFLWAEAKRNRQELLEAITQLILTIGKARTFDQHLPPKFLGAFDADEIGLVPYSAVMGVFYQNDFNWNVTPSDHKTKEFQQLHDLLEKSFQENSLRFRYQTEAKELRQFIRANFRSDREDLQRLRVTKNNFVSIYLKWCAAVRDSIDIDWKLAKRNAILDADFFLADLLSRDDFTLREKLNVVLHRRQYELNRHQDAMGLLNASKVDFKDDGAAHTKFWNRYLRPPKHEYWDYILERRDLLIPQDVRERKGSFFTPAKWVEKAQEYLAQALGENWQDEYVVWDCCAGTGNLLTGLVNKYNVWASTLDKSDVDVMLERSRNGANLLASHIFQFDFLNGDFGDLPEGLREIVQDPAKRRKLVVFINPPYAEHGNAKQISGTGKNKDKVAKETAVYAKSKSVIGTGARELFVQFLYRIYTEIGGCIIGQFSTTKILHAQNFDRFRKCFLAKLLKMFVVPSYTFDNVNGQFPIGFYVWDTSAKEQFKEIDTDIINANGEFQGTKRFCMRNDLCINWIKQFYDAQKMFLAYFRTNGSDIQNNQGVFLTLKLSPNDEKQHFYMQITASNLIPFSVYFTARHCITDTWLNHNDQYLWPNDGWKADAAFQADCLCYTIFAGKNNIRSADGVNHWIPFREEEVNAQDKYASHFLLDYLAGKWTATTTAQPDFMGALYEAPAAAASVVFSPAARAVFDAAREVWRYYHAQPNANPNASFYDIREYFQGRNARGIMNPDSPDPTYTKLLAAFKAAYARLSAQIEPKIYEYGFLLR